MTPKDRKIYLQGLQDAAKVCDDIRAERERSMRHAASQRNYVEAAAQMHKAFMAGHCANAIRALSDRKRAAPSS